MGAVPAPRSRAAVGPVADTLFPAWRTPRPCCALASGTPPPGPGNSSIQSSPGPGVCALLGQRVSPVCVRPTVSATHPGTRSVPCDRTQGLHGSRQAASSCEAPTLSEGRVGALCPGPSGLHPCSGRPRAPRGGGGPPPEPLGGRPGGKDVPTGRQGARVREGGPAASPSPKTGPREGLLAPDPLRAREVKPPFISFLQARGSRADRKEGVWEGRCGEGAGAEECGPAPPPSPGRTGTDGSWGAETEGEPRHLSPRL